MHEKLDVLAERGFVVLRDYAGPPVPDQEFLGLEYMDWKSGGDTNFAPIASALGEMECGGFWDHGKPDKDGIWTRNREICPTLVDYVESVGVRFGRVRVIKLNPYDSEAAALRQLHLDDNNRLNPDGEGWVVRSWLELSDCPGSYFASSQRSRYSNLSFFFRPSDLPLRNSSASSPDVYTCTGVTCPMRSGHVQ